jgi:hypothetical protein
MQDNNVGPDFVRGADGRLLKRDRPAEGNTNRMIQSSPSLDDTIQSSRDEAQARGRGEMRSPNPGEEKRSVSVLKGVLDRMSQAQNTPNQATVENGTGKNSQDSPSNEQSQLSQSRGQDAVNELRTGAVVVGRIADGENNLNYNQDWDSDQVTDQGGRGAARQVWVCRHVHIFT